MAAPIATPMAIQSPCCIDSPLGCGWPRPVVPVQDFAVGSIAGLLRA
jgi:hypothetical protein